MCGVWLCGHTIQAMYSPELLTSDHMQQTLTAIQQTIADSPVLVPNASAAEQTLALAQLLQQISPWWRAISGYRHWTFPVQVQENSSGGKLTGLLTFPSANNAGVVLSLFSDADKFRVLESRNRGVKPTPVRMPVFLRMCQNLIPATPNDLQPGSSLTGISFNPTEQFNTPYLYLRFDSLNTANWYTLLTPISISYEIEQWIRTFDASSTSAAPSTTITESPTMPLFSLKFPVRLSASPAAVKAMEDNRRLSVFTSDDYWQSGFHAAAQKIRGIG
jgi:hypothetical protein